MTIRVGLLCAVAGLGLFSAAIAARRQSGASADKGELTVPASGGPRAPVLVELFTSEGCSSCPPADALLAHLDQTQPVSGAEVIALKEHVDYWDHLGWRDPYSSELFTARQNAYAHAFGKDGIYTPQMIVDGRTEFVGSRESLARQAIRRAAQEPKSAVRLRWAANAPGQDRGQVGLEVRVEQLGGFSAADTPEVFLAITESGLHSDVARGENAGRKLDHVAVVRELRQIGRANPQAATPFAAELVVKILPGWKREHLRAVVFVQDHRSRRVLGAAAIALPPN